MKNPKRPTAKFGARPSGVRTMVKSTPVKSKARRPPSDGAGDLPRLSTRAAWDRLLALLNHEDPKIALAVAQAILDRAWGKAVSADKPGEGPAAKTALLIEVVTGIEPCDQADAKAVAQASETPPGDKQKSL